MKNAFIRCLLPILCILPFLMVGQNPLKKELKGSSTTVFYSPSTFNFTNYKGQSFFIGELNDNRSANWNKQINDSIRIDLIRDFWNYPYKSLFKNKINQDLSKQNIKLDFTIAGGQYLIEPTVDAHFPNFVSYPKKGYYVYTKINMKVSKKGEVLFNKAYQDYYFFSKGHPNYNDDFNKEYSDGTNTAMWIGMRQVLDKFYIDLNEALGDKKVSSDNTPLTMTAIESNVASDKNLVTQQKSYIDAKDKKLEGTQVADNYKMEEPPALPPATNDNLDKAIGSFTNKDTPKDLSKPKETATKIAAVPADVKPIRKPGTDSTRLAERRVKEETRRRAIDSALKVKDDLVRSNKVKQEKNALGAKDKTGQDLSAKRDSILKQNRSALAAKLMEKASEDSAKRATINQKIDLAKKKREEERKKLQAKSPSMTSEMASSSSAERSTSAANNRPTAASSNRSLNMSEEIKRIAKEVEMEEMNGGTTRRTTSTAAASTPPTTRVTPPVPDAAAIKAEREAKLTALKAEREAKLVKLKAEREANLVKLKAQQQADSIQRELVRKTRIDSIQKLALKKAEEKKQAALAVDSKKYVEDSIKLEIAKKKKREAILAAQKSAIESDRNDIAKNPNAGELFATVSTDPPSKLPDSRTPEQRKADRIFVPKNDVSKDLLARVKLITPEEEMKMLSQLKSSELSSVDSVFIEYQRTRPMPSVDSAMSGEKENKARAKAGDKSTLKDKNAKADLKPLAAKADAKKEELKKELIDKGLKTAPSDKSAIKAPEAPKQDVKAVETKSAAEAKADRLDDDIKKKAEELKKKAAAGVR